MLLMGGVSFIFNGDDRMTNAAITTYNDLEEATDWAIANLEPYSMHDFVRDWKETKDVSAWVVMIQECQHPIAA